MTDKTALLALLKRAMDKLDCYYKHTAGEYPGGEPNQNLFPAIREALAEQPAASVDVDTLRTLAQVGKRYWREGPGYYEEIIELIDSAGGAKENNNGA